MPHLSVTTGKDRLQRQLSVVAATFAYALQMNDKQVVVSKLMVVFFKFAEFYGLLADCFHLEGGTLLCSV